MMPRSAPKSPNKNAASIPGASLRVSPLLNHRHVEEWPIDDLRPAKGHSRTHDRTQLRRIARSMERFGFVNPILITPEGEIIAGHGRWEAAKIQGFRTVPVLQIRHLSAADIRAYRLADNRLAELGVWDESLLRVELQGLIDLNVDVEITGFDTVDVDRLLIGDQGKSDRADELDPEPARDTPPVTQIGDVWELGDHRIVCADARNAESYTTLLEGDKVQLAITDPPYNVRIDGHVSGLGAVRHREFAMASGEMTPEDFTAFLQTVCRHMTEVSDEAAIHFLFMDWRHIGELLAAARPVYTEIKNLIVWVKTNAGMGSFYRSQHELILAAKVGRAPHINNFGLGGKRYRTNVWTYPGVNTFRNGRLNDLTDHPTVKPVALIADAIRDCSRPGGIVLDPFLGSGTTILAAERTKRRARGLEIDPAYVDVSIRRWEKLTGKKAVRKQSLGSASEVNASSPVRKRQRPHA